MRGILSSLVILLSLTTFAYAQNDGGLQGNLNAAVDDFKRGEYSSALTAFRVILPKTKDKKLRADILWNIARSLEELDRPRDALMAFERFALETQGADAEAKIAKLSALIYGRVTVQCDGRALMVRLEGAQGPGRPCPSVFQKVEPGSVVVVGEIAGREVARAVAKVLAGEGAEVKITVAVAEPPEEEVSEGSSVPWVLGGLGLAASVSIGLYFLLQEDEPASDPQVMFYIDNETASVLRR